MTAQNSYSSTDRLNHAQEEDRIELDDSGFNSPYTTFSLYGINKKGDLERLGTHPTASSAVAQVTHNEGMDWQKRFTSLVVYAEYMRDGDLMQRTECRWNLGFVLL